MDSATPEQVAQLDATIAATNPGATVVKANSLVTVDDPESIRGQAGARGRGRADAHARRDEDRRRRGGRRAQRRRRDRRPASVGVRHDRRDVREVRRRRRAAGDGLQRRPARRDGEDHRRRRRGPRGDRHADRPAPRDRHPQARRARALRPRDPARFADPRRHPAPVPCVGERGTGRHRPGRQRAAPSRRRGHLRGDVPRRAGRGRARRRHRGGRLGGRASPTATAPRWAGSCCSRRPRRTSGQPDAARRVRRREPGADRLPAPGHDRRRLLRAWDGATGRDRAHAHPGAGRRSGVRATRRSSSGRSTRSRRPEGSRRSAATR